MENQKKGFPKRELIWISLLIISAVGNYFLYNQEKGPKTFNEEDYKKKIAHFESLIKEIDRKNDSLNLDNEKRLDKISDLKGELKDLNKKSQHYENLYEKTIDSIDNMSDNDIAKLFAEQYK
jgi:seryl-tRNA synthetase